jgi:hypothetical protein
MFEGRAVKLTVRQYRSNWNFITLTNNVTVIKMSVDTE